MYNMAASVNLVAQQTEGKNGATTTFAKIHFYVF